MSTTPPSPPFLHRLWPTLLVLLGVLGIPATAIAAFFSKHLFLTLGIGLFCELAFFVFGFAGKVWQKLEDPWVERIASWIDHWIQGIISSYRYKYYRYLVYQHRDFDVKGLSTVATYALELNQVFVELNIDPTTLTQMSANPVQVPRILQEGSHAIWDYITSAPLAKQHLVIIGPPGSGKTTLLKHITLTLIRAYPKNPCPQFFHRRFGTFSEKERKEEQVDSLLSLIFLEGGISESLPHQREKSF